MASIEVFYDKISSEDRHENEINENLTFETLKIKECPSTSDALSLLSVEWFKAKLIKNSSLLSLNFTITGNVDDVPNMGLYNFKNRLMIVFESSLNKNCVIFWKLQGGSAKFQKVFLSDAENNLTRLILDFVRTSVKFHNSGPFGSCNESFKRKFKDFDDTRGFNLLMQASEQNRLDIVKFLIELKICDVNFKINDMSAVDLTWNEENFGIVYELLNANSKFPSNFFLRLKSSEEIENLTKINLQLHNLIISHDKVRQNNVNQISHLIDKNLIFRYFYNLENQSAAFVALSHEKFDIYELLGSKNVSLAPTDPQHEIKNKFETYSKDNKKQVRDIHKRLARKLPKCQILNLLVNSFIGFDDLKKEERLSLVCDAFEILDKNDEIRPILELVASAGKIQIVFDFHRNSVQFLDPTVEDEPNGLCYLNGIIFVAAKNLLEEKTKNEAIGVLAHELCHFAMMLVYRNEARPFAVRDNEQERIFNVFLDQFWDNRIQEKIIERVFLYERRFQDAELIVRVPHILANYYNDDKKINELFKSDLAPFKSLYDYYRDKVLIHIRATIPVLDKIIDDSVKWNNLTPELKSKVKFSDIKFQGEKTTLFDLIDDNLKIYDELSSDQIKKLINSETVEVLKVLEEEDDEIYVERSVLKNSSSGKIVAIDTLINENNPVTIVSDYAGSGKTTELKKLARKLKFRNKSKWIQVFVVQSFFNEFLKQKNVKFETKEEISYFLSSLLKLEKLEKEIFLHLFNLGKIIFLFDGVDEISPTLNDFAMNLFQKIEELSKNIQFITSRPGIFMKNETYRFVSFTISQRNEFFEMFFKKQNLSIENQNSRLLLVNYMIDELEKNKFSGMNVNSPLIIKMFAEECSEHDLSKTVNLYTIFNNFVLKKKSLIHVKGKQVQKDCDDPSNEINISKIYQRFALKLIFRGTTIDKFTSVLEILSNFKHKIPSNFKQINRFGILHLNTVDDFTFTDRNFAEFFCARYFIENILDCDDASEKEMRERLNLFFNSFSGGLIISSFIYDYLELTKEKTNEFEDTIINLMKNEFKNVLEKFIYVPFYVECITKFFRKNNEIIKAIWKLDEDENILTYSLKNFSSSSQEIFKIAQNFLNENEMQKLMNVNNQKGNIFYYFWKSKKNSFDNIQSDSTSILMSTLLRFEENKIEEILSCHNFLGFIKILKLNLSEPSEVKEIFFKNGLEIIFACKNSSEFQQLWTEIELLLDDDDRIKMLTITNEDGNTILHKLFLNDIDENILTLVLSKIVEIFSSLIKIVNIRQETCLMLFNTKFKKENFDVYWKFIKEHTKDDELKNLLLLTDIYNKTFLHYTLSCKDSEIFPKIKDFYEEKFNPEELRNIFKVNSSTNPHFEDFLMCKTPESTLIELTNFLQDIFKNHKKELLELICQKNFFGMSYFGPFRKLDWFHFGHKQLSKVLKFSELLKEIDLENFEKLSKTYKFDILNELKDKMERKQLCFSDLEESK